jgi:hypothetical protein
MLIFSQIEKYIKAEVIPKWAHSAQLPSTHTATSQLAENNLAISLSATPPQYSLTIMASQVCSLYSFDTFLRSNLPPL